MSGLGVDELYARSTSAGTTSYLRDALGSTIALADSAGALQAQYTYDPFGKATVSGTASNPYQFTGRDNDGTGLQYNRARYYSSTLQRFISEDPIGFAGGDPNLHAYAANSPTNYTDPSGNVWQFVGGCAGGVAFEFAVIFYPFFYLGVQTRR